MDIFERAAGFLKPRLDRQILVSPMLLALLFATWPQNLSGCQDAQASAEARRRNNTRSKRREPAAVGSAIALYPDSLVAQILAASTFPEQVVEADRWVQERPDLKGDALGQAVDEQTWTRALRRSRHFHPSLEI